MCQLTETLDELVEKHIVPGCALRVRKNGEIVYDGCSGYADMENRIPVTPDTIYRMCSMTKLVTAVAVMQLVERGKISLDDSIIQFFPRFRRDKSQITIRHLLCHSCGMGQGKKSMQYYNSHISLDETLEERIEKWADMPLDCPIGSSASYNPNVAFDLAGRVVEIVSGQDLRRYIAEQITGPLDMPDSSFEVPRNEGTRWAKLYEKRGTALVRTDDSIAIQQADHGYNQGCGGLYSTLRDYDRFTTMLYCGGTLDGHQILDRDTLWQMRTPGQVTEDSLRPGQKWGLGFLIFQHPEWTGRTLGQNTFGWSGSYGTHMYIDPENDLSVTFMTGRKDIGGADSPASLTIEKAVYKIYCGGEV